MAMLPFDPSMGRPDFWGGDQGWVGGTVFLQTLRRALLCRTFVGHSESGRTFVNGLTTYKGI